MNKPDFSSQYSESPFHNEVIGPTVFQYYGQERRDVDGRLTNVSVILIDDPAKRHEGLHFNDTFVENKLAAGVNASSVTLLPSQLEMYDMLDSAISNSKNSK